MAKVGYCCTGTEYFSVRELHVRAQGGTTSSLCLFVVSKEKERCPCSAPSRPLSGVRTSQDTFYIDPRVEGCDDLATRAKRLGLRTRGFLGAEVTVCVVATTAAAAAVAGEDRTAEEAAAAATVNPKYSRRRDRIHRMVRL